MSTRTRIDGQSLDSLPLPNQFSCWNYAPDSTHEFETYADYFLLTFYPRLIYIIVFSLMDSSPAHSAPARLPWYEDSTFEVIADREQYT